LVVVPAAGRINITSNIVGGVQTLLVALTQQVIPRAADRVDRVQALRGGLIHVTCLLTGTHALGLEEQVPGITAAAVVVRVHGKQLVLPNLVTSRRRHRSSLPREQGP